MADESRIPAVMAFFEAWEGGWDMFVQSYFDFFTEDCIWENCGLPTTRGPQEAHDVIHKGGHDNGMYGIRAEIINISEVDGLVWSERIDHILAEDGSTLMSLPLIGVMEFAEDGRLKHWREYFDPTPMSASAEPS